MKLFTAQRLRAYKKQDTAWATELAILTKKHKSKAAMFKGVAFYKNYIPLFRPRSNKDFFTLAKPGVVYAWNINDLPSKMFVSIVHEAKRKFSDAKTVEMDADPSGF